MKIACLVSGGVDSSVSLKLLKEAGHNVEAFYLKIWLEDELNYLNDCPWEEDLKYIEEICKRENIKLHVVPMQKEYYDTIVAYTISEVKAGRTPNPDVMCNNHVKFGAFVDWLNVETGLKPVSTMPISCGDFDKIASGHYAQTFENNGNFYLKKAPDPIKDQTYFLCNLSQQQLSKIIFPIGHLNKSEVRDLAGKFDLPNKIRKDSQGLCFLGKFKFKDFIKHHLGEKEGGFIEFETGKKIAKHKGYWFYTLGQRDGLGLSGGPWYVVKKDIENNIIYISGNYHSEDKKRDEFMLGNLNFFEGKIPENKNLEVKLRHGPKTYKCTIHSVEPNNYLAVRIEGNDQGIAAGQFAVFYEGDICLGGGVII